MEDHWMWYLTGVVDSIATFGVKIKKRDALNMGYKIHPVVYITRPQDVEYITGMVGEYMEENNIRYYLTETNGSNRIQINNPDDVRRFIEPLLPKMVQQQERAEFLVENILPYFENGGISSKEEFIEVVGEIEKMNEYPIKGKSSKYDKDYFYKEWGTEISE